MKKLLLALIIIIVAGYFYSHPEQFKHIFVQTQDFVNEINDLNKEKSGENQNNEYRKVISKILNTSFEMNINNDSIFVSFETPYPHEIIIKTNELIDILKKNFSNIGIMSYLNSSIKPLNQKEPILYAEYNSENITFKDMRSPRFIAFQDLALYNLILKSFNLDSRAIQISAEYLPSTETDFLHDLINSAFNIFEDLPWVENIAYTFNDLNKTIIIDRDKLFDAINSNQNDIDFISIYEE